MGRARGEIVGALVLVLSLVVGPAVAGAAVTQDPYSSAASGSDLTLVEVSVNETGTAVIETTYATRLDDAAARAGFRELRARIEANRSAARSGYLRSLERLAGPAQSTRIRNATVSIRIGHSFGETYGTVTYAATWTDFTRVESGRLYLEDSFTGLVLGEDTRLAVQFPERYQLGSADPAPTEHQDGRVVWEGPYRFQDLALVLEPVGDSSGTGPAPASAGYLPEMVLVVSAIGAFILAAWSLNSGTFHRGRRPIPAGPVEPRAESAAEPAPPSELLSNEEQVIQALESAGGRAKQQELVAALDWTEAKTSQVLSTMTEAGSIEKFRIGRENVIKLADAGDSGVTEEEGHQ